MDAQIRPEWSLAERVARLERENRLWKRGALLLVAGAVVTVAAGPYWSKPRDRIEAKRFVLRDDAGRERAVLGFRSDGTPALALLNESEEDQLSLLASSDGSSSIDLLDHGRNRVALRAGVNGNASLEFSGAHTPDRAGLFLSPDRTLGLALDQGARRVHLGLSSAGAPALTYSDGKASERLPLAEFPQSPPRRATPPRTQQVRAVKLAAPTAAVLAAPISATR